jgi:tetrahydromethanopterin S-methyltransferase subunit A
MATIQELHDAHEEILERLGHMVAYFEAINGDEPDELKVRMMECVKRGKSCILSAVSMIDEMIELRREDEGGAETP